MTHNTPISETYIKDQLLIVNTQLSLTQIVETETMRDVFHITTKHSG